MQRQRSQDVAQVTTTGHPEGTKPKPGVNFRAAKGGERQVICEIIIKTKTDPYGNKYSPYIIFF
jgi:hypothetical protein